MVVAGVDTGVGTGVGTWKKVSLSIFAPLEPIAESLMVLLPGKSNTAVETAPYDVHPPVAGKLMDADTVAPLTSRANGRFPLSPYCLIRT